MKTKKIVSRLALPVIVFYSFFSCDSDNSDPQVAPTPQLNPLSGQEIRIPADGGRFDIRYRIDDPIEGVSVEASSQAGWIDGFEYGDGKVSFSATENPTPEVREAEITVSYSDQSFTVKARQDGSAPEPEIDILSEREIETDFAGGAFEIRYTILHPTTGGGTLRVAVKETGWITDIETTEELVKFTVAQNNATESRENTITLSYEEATAEIIVKQKGKSGGAYDYEFPAPRLDGFYYGDAYSPGAGNYWFFLNDKGLDEDGNAMPNGTYFLIDLYSDIAPDPSNARIPTGVFTLDPSPFASCAKGTFSRQNSRYYTTDENGKTVETRALDTGTLKITESGNGYLIELDCMTNETNKLWYVYYSGDTLLENQAY